MTSDQSASRLFEKRFQALPAQEQPQNCGRNRLALASLSSARRTTPSSSMVLFENARGGTAGFCKSYASDEIRCRLRATDLPDETAEKFSENSSVFAKDQADLAPAKRKRMA